MGLMCRPLVLVIGALMLCGAAAQGQSIFDDAGRGGSAKEAASDAPGSAADLPLPSSRPAKTTDTTRSAAADAVGGVVALARWAPGAPRASGLPLGPLTPARYPPLAS